MLTICVLHYQNNELTDDCLRCIECQEMPEQYRKLIINNGSTIPYKSPFLNWETIYLPHNRGNIGGQNACFENSEEGWVLFVANDVRVRHQASILSLYAEAEYWGEYLGELQPVLMKPDYYRLGLLKPRHESRQFTKRYIDNRGLKWTWPGYGISIKYSDSPFVDAVTSSCYIMRKKVWREIGGFDESLSSSHEDIDMGIRLKKSGLSALCSYYVCVEHLGNQTLRYTIKDPKRTFYEARIKLIKKHYSGINRFLRLKTINLIRRTQK